MVLDSLIFLPALLIALAISTESFGALMRSIGASYGLPTIGYSSHVRIATIGRIFIIGSAPLVGIFVDKYQDAKIIILVAVVCFFISSVFHVLIIFSRFFNVSLPKYLFYIFTRKINKKQSQNHKNSQFMLNKRVFYGSLLTICIQSTGIFTVNALAAEMPDFRATIVQMTGVITFLGTAIHIFIVDPILARDCDSLQNHDTTINNYIYGRLTGSIINFAIFLYVFLFILS